MQNELTKPGLEALRRGINESRAARKAIDLAGGYRTHQQANTFQFVMQSIGCQQEHCLMCDYGHSEHNLTPDQVATAFDNALSEAQRPFRNLIVDAFGSVLDQREVPRPNLDVLLDKIAGVDCRLVTFETHVDTVDDEVLGLIKERLPNKNIVIELGLETADEHIRKDHLNKHFTNQKFEQTVKKIHEHGMIVDANLLVGVPFLSPKQQLDDLVQSIQYCEEQAVDDIVIFPINIKPETLLWDIHEKGEYTPVSHWLLIEALNQLDEPTLQKIYFAWYGKKQSKIDNLVSIEPTSCSSCRDDLMGFYESFMLAEAPDKKLMTERLISDRQCDCYDMMMSEL